MRISLGWPLLVTAIVLSLFGRPAIIRARDGKTHETVQPLRQDSLVSRPDSLGYLRSEPMMETIGYGFRIGAGERRSHPGVRPIFNPFYEVPVGDILLTAELQFDYESFSVIHVPSFSDFRLNSFGFASKVRWIGGSSVGWHPSLSAGVGFDVLTDNVAVGIPINFGEVRDLGGSTQLEIVGLAEPLVYIGKNASFFYGLTVGLRFLDLR
jgi:hypothetical protein